MMPSEFKVVKLITPTTVAADATTTAALDTLGYSYCKIHYSHGGIASNATAMTDLRIAENDTAPTAWSSSTAIVALTGAAATSATAGFVLPAPSTATVVPTGCYFDFDIDLRKRKRYLFFTATPAQTCAQACFAILGRAKVDPAEATISPITNSTERYQCHLHVQV